jgi:hypothetical protein
MYLAEEESDDVVKILDFVIDNKQVYCGGIISGIHVLWWYY